MSNSMFASSKRGLIQIKHQTPKELCSQQNTNINEFSITLLPNELSHVLDQSQRQRSYNNFGTYFGSYNETACDSLNISDRSTLEENQNIFLLKEKTDLLFPQFLEVLQGRTNDSEVFDTIQNLIQTCAGVSDELRKGFQQSTTMSKCQINNCLWLDQEMKTWKLLFALYKDRIMVQTDGMDCNMPPLGGSEKEVIAQLYACMK